MMRAPQPQQQRRSARLLRPPLPLTHGTGCCWSAETTVGQTGGQGRGGARVGRAAPGAARRTVGRRCFVLSGIQICFRTAVPCGMFICLPACCLPGCRRAAIVPALGHPAGGMGPVCGAGACPVRHNSGPAGLAAGAHCSGKGVTRCAVESAARTRSHCPQRCVCCCACPSAPPLLHCRASCPPAGSAPGCCRCAGKRPAIAVNCPSLF